MDPKQILGAVAEVYASCSTYRDSGQVTIRFLCPEGRSPRTSVKPFTTAFRRPARFRFEYQARYRVQDKWKRYIVWADGPAVRTWWDLIPRGEQPQSLGRALAAATGVSSGSAHTVPALLMPDRVRGSRLTELAELVSLGDEPLDEVICYRLSGCLPPHPVEAAEQERRSRERLGPARRLERVERSPMTVWIERGTLLVRRIEYATQFETFRTENVTQYAPAVGVQLSDDELRFGAPEAA